MFFPRIVDHGSFCLVPREIFCILLQQLIRALGAVAELKRLRYQSVWLTRNLRNSPGKQASDTSSTRVSILLVITMIFFRVVSIDSAFFSIGLNSFEVSVSESCASSASFMCGENYPATNNLETSQRFVQLQQDLKH